MALKAKFAGLAVPEGTARMIIMNPYDPGPLVRADTGEECWIEMHASQSEFGRQVDRKLIDKNLRRRVQRMSARDLDDTVTEKLAGLTTGWLLAMPDGTPVDEPCTLENAIAIYSGVLWLREQVSTFANDLGNFRPTPSENSSTSPNTSSDSIG